MLSRIAIQAAQKSRPCLFLALRQNGTGTSSVASPSDTSVVSPSNTSVVSPSNTERDLVNFPRLKPPIYPGKVRMTFIPEEWFQFFYPKTGVTGPYVFGTGVLAYLFSKEIMVIEHEFWSGLTVLILISAMVKKFGPFVASFYEQEYEDQDKELADFKGSQVDGATSDIENEKDHQWRIRGQTLLFDAKRANVGLQLEAEYRERLAKVHAEVKQKLDYQVETINVKTRLEQKHMVNWIVENVYKSITPTQEAAALKQCFADLKVLAAK